MAWWSWVVIWVGLALALVVMLGLMAWWLFRKLMSVFHALEALADTTQLLDAAGEAIEDQRFERAILLDKSDLLARREYVRERSAERKILRRDTRLVRARAMAKLDSSTREWFTNK